MTHGLRIALVVGFAGISSLGCGHGKVTSSQTVAKAAPAPEPGPAPAPSPQVTAPEPQAKSTGGMAESIYFRFDEHLLTKEATPRLQAVAERMKSDPQIRLRIEGNCDERGTTEYNVALGDMRAQAAKEYLVRLGVAADRIDIVSYGSEHPKVQGHDETAWSENRRDDLVVR